MGRHYSQQLILAVRSPSLTAILSTIPADGALSVFSIFMASNTIKGVPLSTCSPCLTIILVIVPGMAALISFELTGLYGFRASNLLVGRVVYSPSPMFSFMYSLMIFCRVWFILEVVRVF